MKEGFQEASTLKKVRQNMTNLPADTPWWAGVILALIALLVPVVKTSRKASRQEKEIERVHHQVANEHNTNLRDDVDGVWAEATAAKDKSEELKQMLAPVIQTIQAMAESQKNSSRVIDNMASEQKAQRRDVGGLREEIRQMRGEVADVKDDLTDHLIEVAKRKDSA